MLTDNARHKNIPLMYFFFFGKNKEQGGWGVDKS